MGRSAGFARSLPQLQLPLFPAGAVQVTPDLACRCATDTVVYFHGQLTVFSHRRDDVASFRMFKAQLIVHGSVTPANLRPDYAAKTLTVEIHRLGSALQDAAVEQLCATLTTTETCFPTTDLRLIYRQMGST